MSSFTRVDMIEDTVFEAMRDFLTRNEVLVMNISGVPDTTKYIIPKYIDHASLGYVDLDERRAHMPVFEAGSVVYRTKSCGEFITMDDGYVQLPSDPKDVLELPVWNRFSEKTFTEAYPKKDMEPSWTRNPLVKYLYENPICRSEPTTVLAYRDFYTACIDKDVMAFKRPNLAFGAYAVDVWRYNAPGPNDVGNYDTNVCMIFGFQEVHCILGGHWVPSQYRPMDSE